MNEERAQILEMVSKGKISIEDAEILLDALGEAKSPPGDTTDCRQNIIYPLSW
jgi:hypothetical protein